MDIEIKITIQTDIDNFDKQDLISDIHDQFHAITGYRVEDIEVNLND